MKKKYILFIIVFLILFISIIFNYINYNHYEDIITRYNKRKYKNYEKIITITDMKKSSTQFINLGDRVLLMQFNLENGGIKKIDDGYEPVVEKYLTKKYLSLDEFNIILNNISQILNKDLNLDEYNRIKFGGEFLKIDEEDYNNIYNNILINLF